VQLKGLDTSPANAPAQTPAVLASCAPRPGVGAGERRARPSNSGGVGFGDAVLKRWHYGREDQGADLPPAFRIYSRDCPRHRPICALCGSEEGVWTRTEIIPPDDDAE
jgi:hypothetical protein